MINPIDKDKTAEHPGLIPYPHTIGSSMVKPDDVGKLKSRALSAMEQQTAMQLMQIQKQVELLVSQANAIQKRIEISKIVYLAVISFEPFIGQIYHLYRKGNIHKLMMIGPDEWTRSHQQDLEFVNSVRLLSDHTWEIL